MWLARHFPGLHLRPDDVAQMTPEETAAMRRVGRKILEGEADERIAHTKVIAQAAARSGF